MNWVSFGIGFAAACVVLIIVVVGWLVKAYLNGEWGNVQ